MIALYLKTQLWVVKHVSKPGQGRIHKRQQGQEGNQVHSDVCHQGDG